MILEELKKGNLTKTMSSVAVNGVFWRTLYVEGIDRESKRTQRTHDLILPLRKIMYKLLGLTHIREYGHFTSSPTRTYEDFTIAHYSPSVLVRIRETHELNRAFYLFSMVVNARKLCGLDLGLVKCTTVPSGYLPNTQVQLKPLLLCASLFYSYSINEESATVHDLDLASNVLLASCLICCYGKPPYKVLERPTVSAINLSTEFACIIHHAYDIASLLGLLHLLPPPCCLYQPAALVSFHQVAIARESTVKLKSKENRDFVEVHSTYNFIIKLRHFEDLKKVLTDLYTKCRRGIDDLITPIELAQLAQVFYQVLGEFESKLPDLEASIEEVQASVTTTSSKSK